MAYAPNGSKFYCWACSLSESFCYLNLGGLLCIGLQTIEALLDSGSKVTQKPASTPSKKKMANIHMLTYAMAIPKVSNGDQQASESKSVECQISLLNAFWGLSQSPFITTTTASIQIFLLFSLVGMK